MRGRAAAGRRCGLRFAREGETAEQGGVGFCGRWRSGPAPLKAVPGSVGSGDGPATLPEPMHVCCHRLKLEIFPKLARCSN